MLSEMMLEWLRTRNFRVRSDVVERESVTKSQTGKKASVESKVWECVEWKAHGQCSKGGSCSFSHDKQVQGDLHGGQRRKGRLSSPAPNSKAKTDEVREKSSNKFLATMRTSLQTKGENFHSDVKFLKPIKKNLASSRVSKLWAWVRMYMWKKMFLQTCWGWWKAQQKVKERWCERISCIIEGVYTTGLCISRFLSEKNLFHMERENWDQETPSNFPRALGTTEKFGKERVHRQELSRSANFMTAVLASPNSGNDHLAPNKNSGKKGSILR